MKTKFTSFLKWKMLFLLFTILCTTDAVASHFRGGNMSYRCINGGTQIEVKATAIWRANAIDLSHRFYYGPSAYQYNTGTVSFNNGVYAIVDHVVIIPTAALVGNKIYMQNCCRISTLPNSWSDDSFRLEVDIDQSNPCANGAPVTTSPTFFNVQPGNNTTCFQLPAVDPEGDAMTFSIASTAESLLSPSPATSYGAGTLTAGGLLCVNPTTLPGAPAGGYADGTLLPLPYKVTDSNGNSAMGDLFIQVNAATNGVAPAWDFSVTPADNSTIDFYVGVQGSFDLKADDADAGDMVSILPQGQPTGSSFSPALPNASNPNQTTFTWTPSAGDVGQIPLTFIAEDNNGLQTQLAYTLNVIGCTAPVATCKDATLYKDANGNVTVAVADVDDGSVASCGVASITVSPTTFSCSDAGPHIVTLTIEDVNGATDQCTATITIADNSGPTVICDQNNTTTLDAVTGIAVVPASSFDDGSYDDIYGCSNLTFSYSSDKNDVNKTYTCADVTNYDLPFIQEDIYVWDDSNNFTICNGGIRVFDNTGPNCDIKSTVTVVLDHDGNGSITTADVDINTLDNCGIASLALSKSAFDCNDVGTLSVDFIATDIYGNVSTCPFDVVVEDNGHIHVHCMDITVPLDSDGNAMITGADLDHDTGSGATYDNCGIDQLIASQENFDCSHIGANSVVLTVTDINGNSTTCNSVVTIIDNLPPTPECVSSYTVSLDANGDGSLTPSALDNGSYDNCTDVSDLVFTASQTTFDCTDLGVKTITLTVTDAAGNPSSCDVTVTIEDMVKPTPMCQDITVQLDALGMATITPADIDDGSTDNCTAAADLTLALDKTSFDCTEKGANTVTLTVTDAAGNSETCTAIVTVEDKMGPDAQCQDITIQLDANGNATITPAQINNGSTDNCTPQADLLLSADMTAFDCSHLGPNTVTLTVTDADNNPSTCTATVTVEDMVKPTPQCKDITVYLDATGNISITAAQVDDGSYDNCTDAADLGLAVSPSSFTCNEVGTNTVTLTVTDGSGNSETCTAVVTVIDNVDPTALCKDITVELDNLGNYTVNAMDIDNGSNDACEIASYQISWPNGTPASTLTMGCGDVGPNVVTLTVTDNNGNVSTCDATVTVEDNTSPFMSCQDQITIPMNNQGEGAIIGPNLTGWLGIFDACGLKSILVDGVPIKMFNCGDIGQHVVTVQVTDNNDNVTTCDVTVNVVDQMKPTCMAKDITVQLDANGMYAITAADVDDGSSDNCGIQSMTVSPNTFDCSNTSAPVQVTLTVTDNSSNVSTCTAMVTVEDVTPPTATCKPYTVTLDAAGNGTLTADDIDGGSTDACGIASLVASQTTFTCGDITDFTPGDAAGDTPIMVTLTVTDNNGLVSTCDADVTVVDMVKPTAMCQDITVQLDASGSATITTGDIDNGSSDNCTAAADLTLSLDNTSFDCTNIGANTVTLTVTDASGNSETCTATVTVEDKVKPTPMCQDITVQLDASGSATITTGDIDNGSYDNCTAAADLTLSLDNTSFDCTNIGANTVTLTVTDASGNSETCDATVTVEDKVKPTPMCQDITVQLDGSGLATITAAQINNGSSDNCTAAADLTLALDNTSFDCTNIGANTVTLTVTDASGNSETCTATVTVEDMVKPTPVCQDITVQLDGSGLATITAAQINNGSSDNCTAAADLTLSLDNTSFDCTNIGANTVTLTVTDASGNSETCDATVTVEDKVKPTPMCQDITVQLNIGGTATITATDIDNGSTDNCTAAADLTLALSQTSFGCADVGANTVTLTVTDASGNSATCDATVTVEDNINPLVNCVDNIEVPLNAQGNGFVTKGTVTGDKMDACGLNLSTWKIRRLGEPVSAGADVLMFTCADIGNVDVVIRIEDNNGNAEECETFVKVKDQKDPTPLCVASYTVSLDANGEGSLAPSALDNGSTDNCTAPANLVFTASQTSFDCTDLGVKTITLTVTDASGNSATCDVDVTIEDILKPTPMCQDITVQLDGSGSATITTADIDNGSSDNCTSAADLVLSLDKTSFDCTEKGANTVTLTVTDASGNSETCTATVTVEDIIKPTPMCQDITVQLDASGTATITTGDIDNGSSDNCTAAADLTLALDNSSFDCTNIGANTVTLTVTDESGNSETCTATVTVEDKVKPTPMCQDITVQLDASGTATITTGDIDNGSSDNCTAAADLTLALDNTSFDCTNIGANTVTLTVTDASGNSETCDATVTVEDMVKPTPMCQDITVQLDATGTATITAADIDNGSSDNCTAVADLVLSLDKTSFDCTEKGANTVTLTVTDASGNSETCTATVTVEDMVKPTPMCQDITVQLDASGSATITTAQINNGSSDNCTAAADLTLALDNTSFDCTNIGANTVTLTVTDASGNSETCTATVTVEDKVKPTPMCQDITVQLDASGSATITPEDIDNGSTDNCTAAADLTLALDKTSFDCTNIGANTVTLTVTDASGNSETCTAMVTVEDVTGPVFTCPADIEDFSLTTDCNQNVILPALDVTDVCGGPTTWAYSVPGITLIPTVNDQYFALFPVGTTEVTATGTDQYGNETSCTFNVTIIDNVMPTIAGCENIVVSVTADMDNCQGTATWDDSVITASDNCQGYLTGVQITSSHSSGDVFPVGTTTVTYTATDASGNIATCSFDVVIDETPAVPSFTYTAAGLNVLFDNTSTGAVSYAWDFGDGNTSTDMNPQHTFEVAGTYNVCLTATNGCGTSDVYCEQIEVVDSPQNCIDQVELFAGFNLVSFDVMPDDASFASIFEDQIADGSLVKISTYINGAPKLFDPLLPPFANTISDLDEQYGYWIEMSSPSTVTITGTCINPGIQPDLIQGWNLISYIPQADDTPASFFGGLGNNLVLVAGYDNPSDQIQTYDPLLPPFFNKLTTLENGKGYWVRVSNAVTGGWLTSNIEVESRSDGTRDEWGNLRTNRYNFITGNAIDLEKGTQVELINSDGDILGVSNILADGNMSTAYVYGAESTVGEGLKDGDAIYFRYKGELSSEVVYYSAGISLHKVSVRFDNGKEDVVSLGANVYPNPSYGSAVLNLTIPSSGEYSVSLFDATGKYIRSVHNGSLEQGVQKFPIDGDISLGRYQVIVTNVVTQERALTSFIRVN